MKQIFENISVGSMMTKNPVTIHEKEKFSAVSEIFVDKKVRHLPVIGNAGRIVGLITQRDLYRTLAPRKSINKDLDYSQDKIIEKGGLFYNKKDLDSYILSEVMTRDVVTVYESNTFVDVVRLITRKKIGCIVVVDKNDKVVGIVTRHDILTIIDDVLSSK